MLMALMKTLSGEFHETEKIMKKAYAGKKSERETIMIMIEMVLMVAKMMARNGEKSVLGTAKETLNTIRRYEAAEETAQ